MPAPLRLRPRFHRTQGTPACSGTRTEADPSSSPAGVYSASSISVGAGEVNHIDLIFPEQSFSGPQKYHQHLDGCMFAKSDRPMCIPIPVPVDTDYTDGNYVDLGSNQGSMFSPAKQGDFINKLLNIHWCPDQNYFLVKFLGQQLPTLENRPWAVVHSDLPCAHGLGFGTQYNAALSRSDVANTAACQAICAASSACDFFSYSFSANQKCATYYKGTCAEPDKRFVGDGYTTYAKPASA